MKFKVGQRVTVNVEGKEIRTAYDGLWFNPDMSVYHGDTFKIERTSGNSRVKLEGNYYEWSLEWLVLADGEQPDGQWGYKGELYKVENREAYTGELMLVVNPDSCASEYGYKLNDVLKCIQIRCSNRYYGLNEGDYLHRSEYKVLVPVEDEEPTQDVPVQVIEAVHEHEPVTPYGVLEAARSQRYKLSMRFMARS
ncbi:hypothetical protein [Paenibacillus alvei]|uniref:hypothetical protein n=1 Tax=Paenibacillus alvei TaxID=44250 RepID=UPI0022811456|nr:hypothetical protein [Paenibacillus alvei]MCY7487927.1 hypothetical protein [Paenibacillus alvei]